MDHGFAMIMNMFGLTINQIKKLSVNQFSAYLHHATNLLAGYRQGEMEFAYKSTKEDALRKRLNELKADAERRNKNV